MKGILKMGIQRERYNWIEGLILSLTQPLWNRYISGVLCKANSTGVIDSKQLHTIAAQFCPSIKKINGVTFGIETELRESKNYWED